MLYCFKVPTIWAPLSSVNTLYKLFGWMQSALITLKQIQSNIWRRGSSQNSKNNVSSGRFNLTPCNMIHSTRNMIHSGISSVHVSRKGTPKKRKRNNPKSLYVCFSQICVASRKNFLFQSVLASKRMEPPTVVIG